MSEVLGNNLKFLRKNKGVNQSEVASIVGKGATTIGNWENATSEPSISELQILSNFFGINVDSLINIDIKNSDLKVLQKGIKKRDTSDLKSDRNSDPSVKNTVPDKPVFSVSYTGKMPSVVTVDQGGIDNIIYVPVKAQAGYLIGYEDPTFIEELPSFRMPGLSNSTYRMFEVDGISMSPTLSDRDRVICEWVPSLGEIRENRVHVIIEKNGVRIKRVLNRVNERGKLYLKSDTVTHRQDYPLIELDPEDVLEIWYVRLKISSDLREPSELYTRMSDLEILTHEIAKKLNLKP